MTLAELHCRALLCTKTVQGVKVSKKSGVIPQLESIVSHWPQRCISLLPKADQILLKIWDQSKILANEIEIVYHLPEFWTVMQTMGPQYWKTTFWGVGLCLIAVYLLDPASWNKLTKCCFQRKKFRASTKDECSLAAKETEGKSKIGRGCFSYQADFLLNLKLF